MSIDYIYKLLGMKEVELNATRAERDLIKAEVKKLKEELETLTKVAD
ncbi:MAG: hypothetical protein JKY22_12035 [Flavobacteriaceae bacterium]|nr:hypothetical protein [Flavobacteriaceae bacterium]